MEKNPLKGTYTTVRGTTGHYSGQRDSSNVVAVWSSNRTIGFVWREADKQWSAKTAINTPHGFPYGEPWVVEGFHTYHDAARFLLQTAGLMATLRETRRRRLIEWLSIGPIIERTVGAQIERLEEQITSLRSVAKRASDLIDEAVNFVTVKAGEIPEELGAKSG